MPRCARTEALGGGTRLVVMNLKALMSFVTPYARTATEISVIYTRGEYTYMLSDRSRAREVLIVGAHLVGSEFIEGMGYRHLESLYGLYMGLRVGCRSSGNRARHCVCREIEVDRGESGQGALFIVTPPPLGRGGYRLARSTVMEGR